MGLTPPAWWLQDESKPLAKLQRLYWNFYIRVVRQLRKKPIELLIVNGDCIDGKQPKKGGRQLITQDRDEQVMMAVECIRPWRPKKVMLTYGTPYHAGISERWETLLTREIRHELKLNKRNIKIGNHETADVNGVIVDVKHKIGRSTIPHGRFTALARTELWNLLWAERNQRPRADIILRSHVHYHVYCGDTRYYAATLPALEGLGDEYGALMCENTVDFGVMWFDIRGPGDWDVGKEIMDWGEVPASILKV